MRRKMWRDEEVQEACRRARREGEISAMTEVASMLRFYGDLQEGERWVDDLPQRLAGKVVEMMGRARERYHDHVINARSMWEDK